MDVDFYICIYLCILFFVLCFQLGRLNDHPIGKELFIRFIVRVFVDVYEYLCVSFFFGFDDGIWNLIASIPYQCLSFYFT